MGFFLVTGINLHLITPIVCIVCIFYTTLVSTTMYLILITLTYIIEMKGWHINVDAVTMPVKRNLKSAIAIKSPGPMMVNINSDISRGPSFIKAGEVIISSGTIMEKIKHKLSSTRSDSSSGAITPSLFIITFLVQRAGVHM